jgi:hypothetical protein
LNDSDLRKIKLQGPSFKTIENKKARYCGLFCSLELVVSKFGFGASGRNRTDTLLRAPDFESGASTNSATLADLLKRIL